MVNRVTIYCTSCDRSQALVEYAPRLEGSINGLGAVVKEVVALAPHCGCDRVPLTRGSVRVLGENVRLYAWERAGVWWRLPREESAA